MCEWKLESHVHKYCEDVVMSLDSDGLKCEIDS
jgi:hypothetical protein